MPSLPIITSHQNARVKEMRAAFAGNLRASEGWVGVEGENLVGEALRSGIELGTVFVREGSEMVLSALKVPDEIEVMRLSTEVFDRACDTETPQGVALLLKPEQREVTLTGEDLILIAAGIQDPGNLGTLIRSAEAFGATMVMTTNGTASAWSQKCIRASAGSVFRMPVVRVKTHDEIAALREHGVKLYAAVVDDAVMFTDVTYAGACAVMIGSEGSGLAKDLVAMADARVTIPSTGAVESLNAAIAGSLLLYEASRQRGLHRKRDA